LRWDDIDLPKRTIIVRRLKGSTDSVHYLERDEVNGLKLLHRQQQTDGIKAAYVFINERGQPFGRMGIGRMIERAGEAVGLPFPVHVHMLRHSTGYALAATNHVETVGSMAPSGDYFEFDQKLEGTATLTDVVKGDKAIYLVGTIVYDTAFVLKGFRGPPTSGITSAET
jgi:integrase